MARRQLLTREALGSHYDPPTDEREIARHFTLSREDLDLVSERRGAPSRLGFALLLLYMRWPGRVLEAGEKPPSAILAFVGDQVDALFNVAGQLGDGPEVAEHSAIAFTVEGEQISGLCAYRSGRILT